MKIVVPYETRMSTYSCVIECSDNQDAMAKLKTIESWLTRKSISTEPFDTTYLYYCMGRLESPPEEFERIGKAFSFSDAKSLLAEIESHNKLLNDLHSAPGRTLAKGFLFAPFRTPAVAVKGFIGALKSVCIAFIDAARYSRKIYSQTQKQNGLVQLDGKSYKADPISLDAPPKVGIGTVAVFFLAVLFGLLTFHSAVPALFKAATAISTLGLLSIVVRQISGHLRGTFRDE